MQEPPTASDSLPDEPDQGTAADHRLIQAFLRDEPGSVQLLADRLAVVPRMLGGLCRRLGFALPNQHLEDIAQDAILIALRKLDQIKPQVPLDAWLHRLCNFELSNALRRRRRQRTEPLPDDVADRTERALQQFERSEVLLAGLEQLRPLDAAIVRLHQLDGLTLEATSRRRAITHPVSPAQYCARRWRYPMFEPVVSALGRAGSRASCWPPRSSRRRLCSRSALAASRRSRPRSMPEPSADHAVPSQRATKPSPTLPPVHNSPPATMSPLGSAASALTSPAAPVPNGDQALPFQRAMLSARPPPALAKKPPAISSPVGSASSASTVGTAVSGPLTPMSSSITIRAMVRSRYLANPRSSHLVGGGRYVW